MRNLHEEDHHAGDISTVAATLDSGSHINVTVKVQEDFIATGTATLDKLDVFRS
ncbi:MAG: hypothetical protein ACREBC_34220 [Pyrinomonadaceae bacterium]